MAVYADYSYYGNTYLGTAIASSDFPRLALRASEQIDRLTYQRAASDTTNTEAIKMATCAVADVYQAVEEGGGSGGIKSERIGDNSVSYGDNSEASKTPLEQYENAASIYLGSTGLMFAGLLDGE